MLTDGSTGAKVQRYLYTPYGEEWVKETTSADTDRRFTGQEWDKETGMYYMNARYYDPSLAVFITPDPAMSGSNHYAYASCNPIRYNDPTGLEIDNCDGTTTVESGDTFNDIVAGSDYTAEEWAAANPTLADRASPDGKLEGFDYLEAGERLNNPGAKASTDPDTKADGGGGNGNGGGGDVNNDTVGNSSDMGGDSSNWDNLKQNQVYSTVRDSVIGGKASEKYIDNLRDGKVSWGQTKGLLILGILWDYTVGRVFNTVSKLTNKGGLLANSKGLGGKGWKGDKSWKDAINKVKNVTDKENTILDFDGVTPTKNEAMDLLKDAQCKIERVEAPHLEPNPHDFYHINYTSPYGTKGTIKIQGL
jgi:RHS repeat-associated protein